MPFVLLVALGVVEVGYALLDQHVVTKLTREGSNLISRDVTIDDAVTAMRNMSTRPVDFNRPTVANDLLGSQKRHDRPERANYDQVILYQRYEFGRLTGTGIQSVLRTRGQPAPTDGSPDYEAVNADTDSRDSRSPTLPANLTIDADGIAVRHRGLHQTRSDHSPERIRSHRAEHAVFDCVFLMPTARHETGT